MAETRAQLNGARIAPRKARAVANLLKRKGVQDALDQLEHLIKRPSPAFAKLLRSAIANAENNSHMIRENLYIKDFVVNEGIKLKRFMPRAQGRATEIQKKTSRITVVLDERVAGMKRQAAAPEKKEEAPVQESRTSSRSQAEGKPEVKRELGKKGGFLGNLGRKMFQRKAV